MFLIQFVILSTLAVIITKADWVEIPQGESFVGPTKVSGTTFFSEAKTPMNVIFLDDQMENVESHNLSTINPKLNNKIASEDMTKNTNKKPAQSSVIEVFTSTTSTTEFTPLLSSISIAISNPVTTPITPTRTEESRNMRRKKGKKKNKPNNHSDGIEIEDDKDEYVENREIPQENIFSSYSGFMPFIRSIQSTLLYRVHKTVKSKIQVLKNLRDSLLYDIDQRMKLLWSKEESEAREHKGDSHIEFPSNEGALMTIGFLTLAVFLVKLVLQVIAAIKEKKAATMTTTTAATFTGRKKRFVPDDILDSETTFRILNLIDSYKVNSFDYN